jgi:hypothetical protein
MPVISTLRELKQEDCGVEANLPQQIEKAKAFWGQKYSIHLMTP